MAKRLHTRQKTKSERLHARQKTKSERGQGQEATNTRRLRRAKIGTARSAATKKVIVSAFQLVVPLEVLQGRSLSLLDHRGIEGVEQRWSHGVKGVKKHVPEKKHPEQGLKSKNGVKGEKKHPPQFVNILTNHHMAEIVKKLFNGADVRQIAEATLKYVVVIGIVNILLFLVYQVASVQTDALNLFEHKSHSRDNPGRAICSEMSTMTPSQGMIGVIAQTDRGISLCICTGSSL